MRAWVCKHGPRVEGGRSCAIRHHGLQANPQRKRYEGVKSGNDRVTKTSDFTKIIVLRDVCSIPGLATWRKGVAVAFREQHFRNTPHLTRAPATCNTPARPMEPDEKFLTGSFITLMSAYSTVSLTSCLLFRFEGCVQANVANPFRNFSAAPTFDVIPKHCVGNYACERWVMR